MTGQIDTHYSVETAEGVDLVITPAGLCPRFLAYAIDVSIRTLILMLLGILLYWAGDVGRGLMLVFAFLAEWFYPVVFEVFNHGVTPGKKRMGLKVMHDDGTPLTFSSSMLRNLLRVVDFMPLLYGAGLVSMASHPQFKRLGDLAAATAVVYQDNYLTEFQDDSSNNAGQFTLPVEISSLSIEQQKLIVEFGERSATLSDARQAELAGILKPLIGSRRAHGADNGETDQALISLLRQSANRLMGR